MTSWLICLLYRHYDRQTKLWCRDFSFTLKLFWWDHKGGTKHTSQCLLQGCLWFEENAVQAACHLSLHQKNPTGYQIPLRHRRRARWHPILCACVSVHVRDVSWVLDDMSSLRLSGVAVLSRCSPLKIAVLHLWDVCLFDHSPWCWTLSGWTLDWLNGALILTQVEMRDLTETVSDSDETWSHCSLNPLPLWPLLYVQFNQEVSCSCMGCAWHSIYCICTYTSIKYTERVHICM